MPKQKLTLCILAIILSLFIQLSFEQAFPQSVIREMATRKMRYHHYLWHQVREGWNRFPKATQDAFRNINWAPPRPARVYDSNGVSSPIYDNDSGEDFLYMHRQMIATANSIITRNRDPYGRIRGWTTIPGPGDRTFPVPPAYTVPNNPSTTSSSTNRKTDAFYTNSIQRYERMFKDPVQLRQWSLAEFGARMEVTIHGWIHMRWSSASAYGYRTSYRGTIPNIDKQWDDIRYDWLGDSYASHVHPIFWNIHGWVDDRIEDWRRANGLSTIRWKGTWTGGPMENLSSVMKTKGMDMDHMSSKNGAESGMDVLEKAFMILKQSGVPETSFADELAFEDFAPQDKKRVCRIRKAKL